MTLHALVNLTSCLELAQQSLDKAPCFGRSMTIPLMSLSKMSNLQNEYVNLVHRNL